MTALAAYPLTSTGLAVALRSYGLDLSAWLNQWSSFNPTSLFAGGQTGGWWDPSDLTTLFQDSGGTTAVTTTGQPVGMIKDKSGNNNHLTQITAGARPIFKIGGGLSWLEFDGVGQFLQFGWTFTQPVSRISSGQFIVWTNNSSMFDGVNGNSALIANSGGSPGIIMFAGASLADASDYTVGVNHSLVEVFNGASSSLQVDGNAAVTGDAGTGTPSGLTVGCRGSIAFFGNCKWFGGAFIGRLLTPAETNNTRTFFGAKAGLTL